MQASCKFTVILTDKMVWYRHSITKKYMQSVGNNKANEKWDKNLTPDLSVLKEDDSM